MFSEISEIRDVFKCNDNFDSFYSLSKVEKGVFEIKIFMTITIVIERLHFRPKHKT